MYHSYANKCVSRIYSFTLSNVARTTFATRFQLAISQCICVYFALNPAVKPLLFFYFIQEGKKGVKKLHFF